jgi:lipoprotein-anchoring transpeptidase ErfK/SrfK
MSDKPTAQSLVPAWLAIGAPQWHHASVTVRQWIFTGVITLAGWQTGAWATTFELPTDGSALVGTDQRIKSTYQDTLLGIAHRYSLGYEEILRANPGVDMWLPGDGTEILLPGRRILPPGPREGLVVNLPEHRLYYYPKHRKGQKAVVITYPVSIGTAATIPSAL